MTKSNITEYDNTAANNTDVEDVPLGENLMYPSDVNNAFREMMADLADVNDGTVSLTSPSFAAASLTGDLSFGDNDKAIFGAGSDLQIYHDGSNSYIWDAGTGLLQLRTNGSRIEMVGQNGSEYMARFEQDGAVKLYYNNAQKLATTSTGIDVTGTVTADGLTLANNTYLKQNDSASGQPRMLGMNSGNVTYIGPIDSYAGGPVFYGVSANVTDQRFYTGADERLRIASNGDISFYEDTGTTAKFFWDASAESLGIGTSSPSRPLHVYNATDTGLYLQSSDAATSMAMADTGGSVLVGQTSGALQFYTGGDANTAGYLATERMRIDSSGNVGIGTSSPVAALDVVTGVDDRLLVTNSSGDTFVSSVNAANSAYNGLVLNGSEVKLFTNATERLRIDSSGRLGLGISPPSAYWGAGDNIALFTPLGYLGSNGNFAVSLYSNGYRNSSGGFTYLGINGNTSTASGIDLQPDANIIFRAGTASGTALPERMRISNGGAVSIGTTTSSYKLYIKETGNTTANRVQNSFASVTNAAPILQVTADRANSSAYYLLETRSNGTADREHVLRGDGNAFADGVWQSGGADYAEYFEWADGNTSNEDRRGYSVVLVGNQIRKATSSDSVSDIIGVISGSPSVVGDTAWNKWDGKYNTDDFGAYIRETYTLTEWTEADGTEHSYASDEIPSGLVAPADATVLSTDADGNTLTRRQLNASYDDSQTYTPREDRVEWDAVGLMGKLRLRVGQPTGSNWIKMRDTATDDGGNVTIEEWLVR